MNPKVISIILGIVLLSSVASFLPIPASGTHQNNYVHDDEWDKQFSGSMSQEEAKCYTCGDDEVNKTKDTDNDGVPDYLDDCKLSYGTGSDGCPVSTQSKDIEKVPDSTDAGTLEECLSIPPGINNQNAIQCVKELKNLDGCVQVVITRLLEGKTVTYDCGGKIQFDPLQIKPAKNSKFKIKDKSTLEIIAGKF